MTLLKKPPTIQDVARFAKVSAATVSRALSSPDMVSAEARLRVSEAVKLTGYTLNLSARSLRKRTSRTILVGLPDIRNSFFSLILDAIERESALRGYGVLIANRFAGQNATRRLEEYFLSNRADGLLLLDGSLDTASVQLLASGALGVPVVVACEDIPGNNFHTVVTDNIVAATQATRHLLELGHTRIGHILGPEGNILTGERLRGFTEALASAGIAVNPDWLLPGDFRMESGYDAADAFMRLADRPTAIFAANDDSAIGFLSGLRQHGLECPRDISLVGFDDLAVAPHVLPPLTTIRQPREALGRLAASALIDLLEGGEPYRKPLRMVLNSEMILRGSTAPLPPR